MTIRCPRRRAVLANHLSDRTIAGRKDGLSVNRCAVDDLVGRHCYDQTDSFVAVFLSTMVALAKVARSNSDRITGWTGLGFDPVEPITRGRCARKCCSVLLPSATIGDEYESGCCSILAAVRPVTTKCNGVLERPPRGGYSSARTR